MTVRLGLVGVGHWAGRLAAAIQETPGGRLVACHARTPARREEFANRWGVRAAPSIGELVSEVDAVIVATPHSTHADLVEELVGTGCPVLVEKPLALTVDDARRCVEAAERSGSILQVAHYRRRAPATRALRALIDDGSLGVPHLFEGHFTRNMGPDPDRPWRDRASEAPAGAMTALGVHMADNLLYLADEPAVRVTAFSNRIGGQEGELDDMTAALIEFGSGAVGTLTTSLRLPTLISCAAHGSELVAWSEGDGTRLFTMAPGDEDRIEVPLPQLDPIVDNIAHFVECVEGGLEPETGGRQGLAVVEILEAMIRSAADDGRPVRVTDL